MCKPPEGKVQSDQSATATTNGRYRPTPDVLDGGSVRSFPTDARKSANRLFSGYAALADDNGGAGHGREDFGFALSQDDDLF